MPRTHLESLKAHLKRNNFNSLEYLLPQPSVTPSMYEKSFSSKAGSHGFSRLEIGFFALLVVFGGLLAFTKYQDLSRLVEGSMDEGVIKAVQQGIAAYADESRELGSTSLYPSKLDEAETGVSTPQNLFFSNVLPKGIAVAGWAKTGPNEYRAPSGKELVYDPQKGSFGAHRSRVATDMDHPASPPRSEAVVR